MLRVELRNSEATRSYYVHARDDRTAAWFRNPVNAGRVRVFLMICQQVSDEHLGMPAGPSTAADVCRRLMELWRMHAWSDGIPLEVVPAHNPADATEGPDCPPAVGDAQRAALLAGRAIARPEPGFRPMFSARPFKSQRS